MDSHSPIAPRTAGNQPVDSGITTFCAKLFGTLGVRFEWQKPTVGFDAPHRRSDHSRYHRTAPGYGHHT